MKPRRKPLVLMARRWAPLLAGGLVIQINLSGCDKEVRDAVLTGFQGSLTTLVTSIINAFFLSFSEAAAQPTAQAVFETASKWLA